MDDAAVTVISHDLNLMVSQPDSTRLANSDDLLKQGLALADEIDRLVERSDSDLQNQSGKNQLDIQAELETGDDTLLQGKRQTNSNLGASANKRPPDQGLSQSDLTESSESWAKVWFQRGLHKLDQNNVQGARDNFERALQKCPDWSSAWNGLGVAQYRLTHYAEAMQSFRQAIERVPTDATLYYNLGATFYLLGDFVNAAAAFQKAARLSPKEVQAYYGLGLALMRQADLNQAMAVFRRAVALNDHHADSYYGMGYVNYLLGELPAAIASLGKAKQRNPQYAHRYEAFLKHCLQQSGLNPKRKPSV